MTKTRRFCVLYNPLASTGKGEEKARKLYDILGADSEVTFYSLLSVSDMCAFLDSLPKDVTPIITGGDGTLSRFVNDLGGNPTRDIYYYPAGTGNDFLNDLNKSGDTEPFLLNPYIMDLPHIHFNGETHTFLNGVGYGIDGYVCEEGNRIRKKTGKPINYTAAALKGLLYAYKQTHATVTVDGQTLEFDHVWMTPTMLGRFFGGGMMCAPGQDRLNQDGTVSLMVMRCKSKLRTLLLFPTIFKGNHVKKTQIVSVFKGHEMHVKFDRPTALQIDGEVFSGITEYTVTTAVAEERNVSEVRLDSLTV
ncbi:MAG: diacylglycerol kinase family protein [Oscillospiraceae bacterium]|nr:diacylglycerol kinase family protein [Clostridia bacterium]MBP3699393.1 diacylglycerol kinase family protein [Oscillospiraceae bacterium]